MYFVSWHNFVGVVILGMVLMLGAIIAFCLIFGQKELYLPASVGMFATGLLILGLGRYYRNTSYLPLHEIVREQ